MKHTTFPSLLCLLFALAACGNSQPDPDPGPSEGNAQSSTMPEPPNPPGVGPRPDSWVQERHAETQQRLQASEASRLVWQAIEAHGGLRGWLTASTISFEFDYQPLAQPERRMHTHSQVDAWSARAKHVELDGGAGAEATFGWNGEQAWIVPSADAFPTPARFWALTPYYFVGMPFVAADPGTNYEQLPDAQLDGATYNIVKLTYGEGVGDAPDDYYVLYLHPETHRLAALRYVVSYPGFFEPGQHSPEKIMRYSDFTEVSGLQLAQRLDTSAWNAEEGTAGDVVTRIEVSRLVLGERWPESLFSPPEGAVVTSEVE